MLKGQVPEHVPHWMQLVSCSHPATPMISLANPRTRSAWSLIVRLTSIIRSLQREGLILARRNNETGRAEQPRPLRSQPPRACGLSFSRCLTERRRPPEGSAATWQLSRVLTCAGPPPVTPSSREWPECQWLTTLILVKSCPFLGIDLPRLRRFGESGHGRTARPPPPLPRRRLLRCALGIVERVI